MEKTDGFLSSCLSTVEFSLPGKASLLWPTDEETEAQGRETTRPGVATSKWQLDFLQTFAGTHCEEHCGSPLAPDPNTYGARCLVFPELLSSPTH